MAFFPSKPFTWKAVTKSADVKRHQVAAADDDSRSDEVPLCILVPLSLFLLWAGLLLLPLWWVRESGRFRKEWYRQRKTP